jgi:very-short-patch-repair endonuclease
VSVPLGEGGLRGIDKVDNLYYIYIQMKTSNYNKNLKHYARENRLDGTKGEAILWKKILRAKKTGYQFNRQFSIENYIVDFISRELKLIIEIDGSSHDSAVQSAKDLDRENALRELGYTIIRFKEVEVTHQVDEVVDKIEEVIWVIEERNS